MLLSGGLERSNMVDDAHLRQFIEERAPWFKGSIDHISWRMVVRFERRLAQKFGQNRVWLAGDAAHTTGPVGVQSMNIGLFETWELAHAMSRVLHEGAPLSEVEGCAAAWHAEWRRLHGLAGGLKAGPNADPWIASHATALLSCIPAHGRKLAALAGQIGLTL
jgi:2-polyprenyl-6-methoxyphenol hydroxylase-like FAD-dependent oxidoreductase